jgi:hypothetical protein
MAALAAEPLEAREVGVGVRASTLGLGLEFLTPLNARTGLRLTLNRYDYDAKFIEDGVHYAGTVKLDSAALLLDCFPRGKHLFVSFGAANNRNRVNADAFVPAGDFFEAGDTYQSSATDPVTGKGHMDFADVAPILAVGWRKRPSPGGHFGFLAEVGAMYQGDSSTHIRLAGHGCHESCLPLGLNEVDAATDPQVQAGLRDEERQIDRKMSRYAFYPILTLGIAYHF